MCARCETHWPVRVDSLEGLSALSSSHSSFNDDGLVFGSLGTSTRTRRYIGFPRSLLGFIKLSSAHCIWLPKIEPANSCRTVTKHPWIQYSVQRRTIGSLRCRRQLNLPPVAGGVTSDPTCKDPCQPSLPCAERRREIAPERITLPLRVMTRGGCLAQPANVERLGSLLQLQLIRT